MKMLDDQCRQGSQVLDAQTAHQKQYLLSQALFFFLISGRMPKRACKNKIKIKFKYAPYNNINIFLYPNTL